jgi:hypothetical protein
MRAPPGCLSCSGIEADYYPGCQRFLAPWIERHPFDVVLGSVHYLDYWATEPDPAHAGRRAWSPTLCVGRYFANHGRTG